MAAGFQALAWHGADVYETRLEDDEAELLPPRLEDDTDSRSGKRRAVRTSYYTVTVTGRTAAEDGGRGVSVRLLGFCPYFLVRVGGAGGDRAGARVARALLEHARALLASSEGFRGSDAREARVVQRANFYGFTNNRRISFVALSFNNQRAMREAVALMSPGARGAVLRVPGDRAEPRGRALTLFDAKLEPLLRLMERLALEPCGWLSVARARETHFASSEVCLSARYSDCVPLQRGNAIAPFRVLSYDIECLSLNGGFPTAARDYTETANDILSAHRRATELRWTRSQTRALVQACIFRALGAQPPPGDVGDALREAQAHGIAVGRQIARVYPQEPVDEARLLDATALIRDDVDDFFRDAVKYADAEQGEETPVSQAAAVMARALPALKGDPIIQIGFTVNTLASEKPAVQWIGTLGTCSEVAGVTVESFDSERALLLGFRRRFLENDPDVYCGYNVWGFDLHYMHERAQCLGAGETFLRLSRYSLHSARYEEKRLESSAMGSNDLRMISIPGCVNVDLMHVARKEFRLSSYSLNSVAEHVLQDRKLDISPAQIFELQRGDARDRARIAEYCVKDCWLVAVLMERLLVVINAMQMANVTYVPLQYIMSRGQSIKALSLVAREARARRYAIPMLQPSAKASYEGACVLSPDTGLHREPVCTLDFASLYPSIMISHNIGHESKFTDPSLIDELGLSYRKVTFKVLDAKGAHVGDRVVYYAQSHMGADDKGRPYEEAVIPAIQKRLLNERRTTRARIKHRRVELADGRVLEGAARALDGGGLAVTTDSGESHEVAAESVVSATDRYNDLEKKVLNGQQLALKITANSLYGSLGASTSHIFDVDLAASITATGRELLLEAKGQAEAEGCTVVYGDTDSIMVKCPPGVAQGAPGAPALADAIAYCKGLADRITATLPRPQVLEYEKTFCPFMLISRKRYVTMKVEEAGDTPKLNSNGIVLTRRDNCPALKDVVRDLLEHMLAGDTAAGVERLKATIADLCEGRVPIENLVITATLGANYKNPKLVRQAVLAERIGSRTPALKPRANDRVAFCFFKPRKGAHANGTLQGARIETPEFMRENGLEPDYPFYVEHQILKPVCQFLAHDLQAIPGHVPGNHNWRALEKRFLAAELAKGAPRDKARDAARAKLDQQKAAEARRLVFDPILARLAVKNARQKTLSAFFSTV